MNASQENYIIKRNQRIGNRNRELSGLIRSAQLQASRYFSIRSIENNILLIEQTTVEHLAEVMYKPVLELIERYLQETLYKFQNIALSIQKQIIDKLSDGMSEDRIRELNSTIVNGRSQDEFVQRAKIITLEMIPKIVDTAITDSEIAKGVKRIIINKYNANNNNS